jgi:hypothetical protein
MIALNPDDGEELLEAGDTAPSKAKEPIVFPVTIAGEMDDSTNSFKFEGVFEPDVQE